MPINFACECGKQFTVADSFANKRTKCPVCREALTVPPVPTPESPPDPASEEDEAFRLLAETPDGEPDEAPPALARRDPDPAAHNPSPRPATASPTPATQRKRPRRTRPANPGDAPYERPRIFISPGVLGGLASMALGAIWFIVGLAGNRIYFYAPVVFFLGLVAVIRGLLGYAED